MATMHSFIKMKSERVAPAAQKSFEVCDRWRCQQLLDLCDETEDGYVYVSHEDLALIKDYLDTKRA